MRIDPAIRALQHDVASQARARRVHEAAKRAWQQSSNVRPVLADLQRFGAGHPLSACGALQGAIRDPAKAHAFAGSLMDALCAAMRREPLGQVPFRHQLSGGVCVVQIAQTGRATLSLVAHDGPALAMQAPARSVCFSDSERHEVYLAGSADARLYELVDDGGERARFTTIRRQLVTGETLTQSGYRQSKLVRRVNGALVTLRLGRAAASPAPSREFALADGTLLHRASAMREESRLEMAIALLGRMGRSDAAPHLAELSQRGGAHLRWQAVRHCLALDTAKGIAALDAMADDRDALLRAQAHSLRARLGRLHPAIAGPKGSECPA